MYGYIYLTTNLINGKKYVGKRCKNYRNDTDYIGSGTIIKKANAKYGRENFSKEIIEECYTLEELNSREEYWINYYNAVEDPNFYNLTPKANGSAKGSKRSEDTKRKLSESASKRHIDKETRSKISETVSSQIWVTNGIIETKATLSNIDEFISNGFHRGRLEFSESHRNNLKNCRLGSHLSDEEKNNLSLKNSGSGNPFYGRTHSDESINKMSLAQSGRVYVNNGSDCKRVKKDTLEYYISIGYVRGMLRKSK